MLQVHGRYRSCYNPPPDTKLPRSASMAGNLESGGGGDLLSFEPSLPACIGLSALGGLLEVTSTMCLAFPEFKAKLGRPYRKCTQRVLLAANLALMGLASVLYIVGSWFGPVSISVPTVMVSKLLSNLVIMGLVLRMADFPKAQQAGTKQSPSCTGTALY